nr:putative ribonuclease H-like domain-containing protein [Tanacetum cinerariifolium]
MPQRLRTPAGLSTSFHHYKTFTHQWDQCKTDHEYSKNTLKLRGSYNPTKDNMTYKLSIDEEISFYKASHGMLNLHMGEFRNKEINDFCSQKRIKREFSNARTPQQNGVAERRNRTLIKAARTMLADAKLPVTFWAEAVNTACYVQNRPQDHCSTEVSEGSGNSNPTASTSDPPADQMETLTVETLIPTVKPSSDAKLISKRVANQEETPSLDNILSLKNRFEDILRGTSPKRLVAQRHTQEEGIDYDEVFAPVARIEAIRLFLAYPSFMSFTVYQMDVKSAFLYGTIDEEVYVMQPPGFQDPKFLAKVYKVEKAMYELHQAPRAWYGTLSKYLLKNGFQRGTIDQTLFIRKQRDDFILVQVYVDDIIFGSSNPQLCREFEALMHDKFQMSAMGELNFFLGLQVLQKKDGIFLSQDKYIGDILKKFRYSDVRSSNTPMDKENSCGKDETGKDVDLHLYRSMIGSLMYLTASRPDIMFAVCACVRHQVTPKECHLHAVKRIFRYLKGYPKLGLWYPKESPFDLVSFSESDYGSAT